MLHKLSANPEVLRRQVGGRVRQVRLMRQQIPRNVQFSVSPTYGVTRLHHETTSNGTGAGVTPDSGELVVSSGTDSSGAAMLRTRQRGQYRGGTEAEAGIGVGMGTVPSGDQDAKWGYFDDTNGFGFGRDSAGLYIFRRSGGNQETKVYQVNWNQDPLNTNGLSGLGVDMQDGHVFNLRFDWYGHGAIKWVISPSDKSNQRRPDVVVHREIVRPGLSIEDPNQPIQATVSNNGTASALDVRVSEMQFSLLGDGGVVQRRMTPFIERGYTLGSADTWESVIALRKKASVGSAGAVPSPTVQVSDIGAVADKLSEVRVLVDADVSGVTWADPEGVPSDETAVERSTGTSFTVNDAGVPIASAAVERGESGSIEPRGQTNIGSAVALVQVRSGNNTAFEVVSVTVDQQW